MFKALNNLKSNKSPGLDGIPSESYQVFWSVVGQVIAELYNSCLNDGIMPETMRIAIMCHIFKNGMREEIKNYKKISADYKILAFMLANRLQSVVVNYKSNDQTACFKGIFIGQNVWFMLHIIEKAEEDNHGGLLFFLDFRKVFDSLKGTFMYRILEKSTLVKALLH